jgi:ABC-type thiamin/hydroxymethylpyrimidine transport system permease subunit
MNDLFNHYREKTALSAPPELTAAVMSRLASNQFGLPPLFLIFGSSAGLAAAIAFALTLLASNDQVRPPSAASLFGATGAEVFAIRP